MKKFAVKMICFFNRLFCGVISGVKGERGQTLVEYGLLLVLIAVVVMGAVTFVGENANNLYGNASNMLP